MNFRQVNHLPALKKSFGVGQQFIRLGILILVVMSLVYLVKWWRVTKVFCVAADQTQLISNCAAQQLLSQKSLLTLDLDAPKWLDLKVITDDRGQNWSLVSWSKKLPQTVKLNYVISPFQYILVQASQAATITADGKVKLIDLKAISNFDLPRVNVADNWPQPLVTNGQIEANFDTWIKQIWQTYLPVATVKPSLNLIDVFQAKLAWSNWELILTPLTDPSLEFERYKLVFTSLEEKNENLGKNYRSLDVRFKLPILLPINSGAMAWPAQKLLASASANSASASPSASKIKIASNSAKSTDSN